MEALKKVSGVLGQATQVVKNNLDDFSEKNDLKGKSEQAKANIIHKYEEATGRNAAVDQTILKYSAVATATAVGISMAPAVLVGGAVAVAIAIPAKNLIQKNYKIVTGRDVGSDLNEAKSDIKNLSSEVKQSFNQGRQQENKRIAQKNNQLHYNQHDIQAEGQEGNPIQYNQEGNIILQNQYEQFDKRQMGEELPQYQLFQPDTNEEIIQYRPQESQHFQQSLFYQPDLDDGWNKK